MHSKRGDFDCVQPADTEEIDDVKRLSHACFSQMRNTF